MPMVNSRKLTIKKNLLQFRVALALQELSQLSPSRWTGAPLPSSNLRKTRPISRWSRQYLGLEQTGEHFDSSLFLVQQGRTQLSQGWLISVRTTTTQVIENVNKKNILSHQSSSGSLTMVQRRAFGKTAGTMMANIPLKAWIAPLIMNTRSSGISNVFRSIFISLGGLKLLVWVGHEDLKALDPPSTIVRQRDWQRKSARMAALLFHQGCKPGCLDCSAHPRESNHHHPRGGSTFQERLPLHRRPGEIVKNS